MAEDVVWLERCVTRLRPWALHDAFNVPRFRRTDSKAIRCRSKQGVRSKGYKSTRMASAPPQLQHVFFFAALAYWAHAANTIQLRTITCLFIRHGQRQMTLPAFPGMSTFTLSILAGTYRSL